MLLRRTYLGAVGALLAAATIIWGGGLLVGSHAAETGTGLSYFDGLRAGIAQGREEGRALQLAEMLPAGASSSTKTMFSAGYAAGWNDAFAGYDGGWAFAVPYVVTLEKASGPITYRIGNRTPLQPKIDYYLCANGRDLCQCPQSGL